jgi:hypothetical protein
LLDPPSGDTTTTTEREVRQAMIDLTTSATIPAILIAAGSVFHIFTGQVLIDGVIPLAVAVASPLVLLLYTAQMPRVMSEGRMSGSARAANFGIVLPWGLASFVVAY